MDTGCPFLILIYDTKNWNIKYIAEYNYIIRSNIISYKMHLSLIAGYKLMTPNLQLSNHCL